MALMARAKKAVKHLLFKLGYQLEKIHPEYPVLLAAIDPVGVEILSNSQFQSSCREIAGLTLLDVPRLANLWHLCQLSNPNGSIIEVGTYRGGSALHLSNSCPDRGIIVCDSFTGFELIDPEVDTNFKMSMFTDTGEEAVRLLFQRKQRNARLIKGYFPESCRGVDLQPISFAHVDVDTYKATIETLFFLDDRMIEKSLIVLDDYNRRADGVNRAISEFSRERRCWAVFPIFPSQAILIHKTWLD